MNQNKSRLFVFVKQDSLLARPIKIKVIEKLKLVSPANIKKIQLAESDIRGIPVSSDQKPTSHSFFNDKNSPYARMITAIENNNAESMTKIISESPNANFNIKDTLGRTLLDIAYTNKCKFETQYSDTDEYRYELFHYKKMIFILLIHLNINDRTVQQKSILHIAAEEKASFVDLAIFLLRGVDPDMRDASGKKPLTIWIKQMPR